MLSFGTGAWYVDGGRRTPANVVGGGNTAKPARPEQIGSGNCHHDNSRSILAAVARLPSVRMKSGRLWVVRAFNKNLPFDQFTTRLILMRSESSEYDLFTRLQADLLDS